jgi:sugar phosphate isomerase/epimerase
MRIGIQLYSIPEDYNRDYLSTLKSLASMGYEGVEFAFSFGKADPEKLADCLEDEGLKAVGIYSDGINRLFDGSDDIYVRKGRLGYRYVTVGTPDMIKEWDSAIKTIERAGEEARRAGMTLLYHNHAPEVGPTNIVTPMSMLSERTDRDLVRFELDTHFISKAGGDPVEWLEKSRGRVPLLHCKDINRDGSVAEAGEGILDMDAICRKAGETGVEWLIVEFSDIRTRKPMESARICIENIVRHKRGIKT